MKKFEGVSRWIRDLHTGEVRLATDFEIINGSSYERTFICYADTHEVALSKLKREGFGVQEVVLSE